MGKDNNPQMITIDDIEYNVADLTDEQKVLVNHCLDLDRKIGNTQFQLDQLRVGKDAFFALLKQSLDTSVTDVEVNPEKD
jgi:hypothetical protein